MLVFHLIFNKTKYVFFFIRFYVSWLIHLVEALYGIKLCQ